MLAYLARRLALSALLLLGVVFATFLLHHALPGDPAAAVLGKQYTVEKAAPWMDGADEISVPVSHQDQVVLQPPNTDIIVTSEFTPYAALAWTDRPAISFQFHPEFEPDYAKALIKKRYDVLPNPDAALASLDQPDDRARVTEWIRRFLTSDKTGEQA